MSIKLISCPFAFLLLPGIKRRRREEFTLLFEP